MSGREGGTQFIINTLERIDADIIGIQGSIGAGKTTLLERIEDYINEHNINAMNPNHFKDGRRLFLIMTEPLTEWDKKIYPYSELPEDDYHSLMKIHNQQSPLDDKMSISSDGVNEMKASHFDLFNINPKRYALSFQMAAKATRLSHFIDTLGKLPVLDDDAKISIITERSMLSDRLFAKNAHHLKLMGEPEWDTYQKMYTIDSKSIVSREKTIIYIPTDPYLCQERIKIRGRLTEQNLPVSYLESLHREHKELINQFKGDIYRLDEFTNSLSPSEMNTIVNQLMVKLSSI